MDFAPWGRALNLIIVNKFARATADIIGLARFFMIFILIWGHFLMIFQREAHQRYCSNLKSHQKRPKTKNKTYFEMIISSIIQTFLQYKPKIFFLAKIYYIIWLDLVFESYHLVMSISLVRTLIVWLCSLRRRIITFSISLVWTLALHFGCLHFHKDLNLASCFLIR